MAITSSDGRPPSRRRRMLEWRWFLVAGVAITAGAVIALAVTGVGPRAIVAGIAFALALLIGASPVLAAGLLRGKEERKVGEHARFERRPFTDR